MTISDDRKSRRIQDTKRYRAICFSFVGNPAGQTILKEFFANGVSPMKLLVAAAGPTVVVWLLLLLLH